MPKPAVNNRSKADNLFDRVVGADEQGRRDFEAENFDCLEIDGEPILRGSLSAGFSRPDDAVDIRS